MINVVIVLVDQLPNRDNTVTLLLQIGNNAPDGSWRTGPGVMKQHDGTGLNLAHHTLVDLVAAQALPIERVHRPLDGVIAEEDAVETTLLLYSPNGGLKTTVR